MQGNQTVFDAIGAGSEVASLTPVERLLVFSFADPLPANFSPFYDGNGTYGTNQGRIRVYGTVSVQDPTDFTSASLATAPTWIKGGLRAEVAGEFLYMDAQLSAFQIAEYYVKFDDAETVFPIRPGTVLQKRFRRFEIVALQVENLLAFQDKAFTNGSFAREVTQAVRFYAGFGLAMHSRPDLRVKVSDVAANLALANNQNIQVLNTQVSGISARVVGELNGIAGPWGALTPALDATFQVTTIGSGGPLQAMIFDGADAVNTSRIDGAIPANSPLMARYTIRVLVDWDKGAGPEEFQDFSVSIHSFAPDDPLLAEDGYGDVYPASFGTAGYAKQVHGFAVILASSFTTNTGSGRVLLEESFIAPVGLVRRVLVNSPSASIGEANSLTFRVLVNCGVIGTPENGVDYSA